MLCSFPELHILHATAEAVSRFWNAPRRQGSFRSDPLSRLCLFFRHAVLPRAARLPDFEVISSYALTALLAHPDVARVQLATVSCYCLGAI